MRAAATRRAQRRRPLTAGVHSAEATPLAAALQWVFRDGAGMLGGLVFAWWGGPRFDADVKTWRLFADLSVDAAMVIEMFAPWFPSLFFPLICLASVLKVRRTGSMHPPSEPP